MYKGGLYLFSGFFVLDMYNSNLKANKFFKKGTGTEWPQIVILYLVFPTSGEVGFSS